MAIRLVLADDHPIVLDGLEQLFRLEPDFEVVARCRDGEEALRQVRLYKPDILVLDIRMPRRDGLQVLQALLDEGLPTRVVLLTAALDEDQLVEATEAALAKDPERKFLLKGDVALTVGEVREAMDKIRRGGAKTVELGVKIEGMQ